MIVEGYKSALINYHFRSTAFLLVLLQYPVIFPLLCATFSLQFELVIMVNHPDLCYVSFAICNFQPIIRTCNNGLRTRPMSSYCLLSTDM
jgi:hypothetical protein